MRYICIATVLIGTVLSGCTATDESATDDLDGESLTATYERMSTASAASTSTLELSISRTVAGRLASLEWANVSLIKQRLVGADAARQEWMAIDDHGRVMFSVRPCQNDPFAPAACWYRSMIFANQGLFPPYGIGMRAELSQSNFTIAGRATGIEATWSNDGPAVVLNISGSPYVGVPWRDQVAVFTARHDMLPSIVTIEDRNGDILTFTLKKAQGRSHLSVEPQGRSLGWNTLAHGPGHADLTFFPGESTDFSGRGFTVKDAYEELLRAQPGVAAQLEEGACIAEIRHGGRTFDFEPLPGILGTNQFGIRFAVVDANEEQGWTVIHERTEPTGERVVVEPGTIEPASISCADLRRSPLAAMSMTDALDLAQRIDTVGKPSVHFTVGVGPWLSANGPPEQGWWEYTWLGIPSWVDPANPPQAYMNTMVTIDAHTGNLLWLTVEPPDLKFFLGDEAP